MEAEAHKLPHMRSALSVGQSNSRGQAQIPGHFLMRGVARSHCQGACSNGRDDCSRLCKELTVLEGTGKKRGRGRE